MENLNAGDILEVWKERGKPETDDKTPTERPQQEEAKEEDKTHLPALYVPSLLTIETCGYFDAGYKRRYPKRPNEVKTVAIGQNRTVRIIPSTYGYPNSDDSDFLHAFYRICDEQAQRVERINHDGTKTYHYHLPQPVRVPTKKLLRYASRSFNAREKKAVRDFFERNGATSIKGELQDPKTREYGSLFFSLFSQIAAKGEKMKDGTTAETNFVWFSPYALRSYYWRLTRRVDLNFHNQLTKAISKALYPYLDTGWFAAGSKAYTKTYISLCDILSLRCEKYLSLIRKQLDPTHNELKTTGYLERWHYKQNDHKEFSITWWPGQKWFEDQKARGQTFTPTLSAPAESNQDAGDLAGARAGDTEHEALAQLLADDILAVLHDHHSRQFYLKVSRTLPEQQIRRILSEIKADILNNPSSQAKNPPALFTTRVKDLARDLGVSL